MEKLLKVEIKKRVTESDGSGYSYEYDIKINGHKLSRGVTDVKLDMKANEMPRLTIECVPDELDIETEALLELAERK